MGREDIWGETTASGVLPNECKAASKICIGQDDLPDTLSIDIKLGFLPLDYLSSPKPTDIEGKVSRDGAHALSQDMGAMMKDTNIADFTIKCDGKEFFAHKLILSARSSVFAAMFSHEGTKESETGEVTVTDCEADTMDMFLKYIYTGELPEATFEVAEKLVNAATKYQVQPLIAACIDILGANMDEDNAIRVAIVSDIYNIEGLKKDALAKIRASKKPLKNMKGWNDLDKLSDLKAEILDCKAI